MKINKKLTNFFSSLGDETRLKILISLRKSKKNVNDIHKEINNITLSAISHQLKYLENNDIVLYEKKGKEKIYQLNGEFCWCILNDAITHFKD